jgi:hypothetical protein
MREYKLWKWRRMYDSAGILRNSFIVVCEFSKIEAHMMSPITRHNVWNIKFFFLSSDLIMRIAQSFSLSCAVLCCSNKSYVLRIAWWNDSVINEPISVAGRSKAWDSVRLFAWNCGFESNRVHPFLSLVIVVW